MIFKTYIISNGSADILKEYDMSSVVEKGWGRETIFASTASYCGKFLEFDRAGSKFSMHFHQIKDETWCVLSGSFKLTIINTSNATTETLVLAKGDCWRNMPLVPHQLEALEDNSVIVEVSSADSVEDNFRVFPGDSQNNTKE